MWPLLCFRFTYEIAPVFVLLEYVTLKKMREIIGWPGGSGDGIFSPGIWYFNLSSYFILICHALFWTSVQFSHSVMSDSLRPHGLQQARLPCPCPSLTPRACSKSFIIKINHQCPLSWWRHPTISCSVNPFPSCLIFPSIRVFSNESALSIRWPKHWSFSFSISPSNEYSGLISFRMDCFDLFAVQGTLKSLLQHQSSKTSILRCSAFTLLWT